MILPSLLSSTSQKETSAGKVRALGVSALQLEWMKRWNAEAQAVLQDDAKIISFGLSDRV